MISVIVPCRNRLNKIKMCIDSILNAIEFSKTILNDVSYEIVIINDHSDDGFKEELKNIYEEKINIIDSDGVGPGYARNLGIKKSNGQYIFFTDSDCVVAKDWIVEGYKLFKKSPELVIQGIPWLFQKNENEFFGEQEELLYEIMFSSYLNLPHTSMTDSRNLLINKDIVNIMGNDVFGEQSKNATAESRVFGKRLNAHGIKILFAENVKIYHEDSLTMNDVCGQKYRHGSGRVMIWENKPDYNDLKDRYYDNPIKNGLDKKYIIEAHTAFLLGYYQHLNDIEEYYKFLEFAKSVCKEYEVDFNSFEFVNKKILEYGK